MQINGCEPHPQESTQKWIKQLNVRHEAVRCLEKLWNIHLGNDFLDMTLKSQATKANIDKWDYVKLKAFCIAWEMINKMIRQPTNWEKTITNSVSGKKRKEKKVNTQNSQETYSMSYL